MSTINQLIGHVELNKTTKTVDNAYVNKKISKGHKIQPAPIQASNIQSNNGSNTSTSTP